MARHDRSTHLIDRKVKLYRETYKGKYLVADAVPLRRGFVKDGHLHLWLDDPIGRSRTRYQITLPVAFAVELARQCGGAVLPKSGSAGSPPVEPAGVAGPVRSQPGIDKQGGKVRVIDLATADGAAIAVTVLPDWWWFALQPHAAPNLTLDKHGRRITEMRTSLRRVNAPEPNPTDDTVGSDDVDRIPVDDAVDRPRDGAVAPGPGGDGNQQHDDDDERRGHLGSLTEDDT